MELSEMGLRQRTHNALRRAGYNTKEEVLQEPAEKIIGLHNMNEDLYYFDFLWKCIEVLDED